MKVRQLVAKNFLSFDATGIAYECNDGINTIVGENNSGKSSLIKILREIRLGLENKTSDTVHAHHYDNNTPILLEATVQFSPDEMRRFATGLGMPERYADSFAEMLGDTARMHIEHTSNGRCPLRIYFGSLVFDNHELSDKDYPNENQTVVGLEDILNNMFPVGNGISLVLTKVLRGYDRKKYDGCKHGLYNNGQYIPLDRNALHNINVDEYGSEVRYDEDGPYEYRDKNTMKISEDDYGIADLILDTEYGQDIPIYRVGDTAGVITQSSHGVSTPVAPRLGASDIAQRIKFSQETYKILATIFDEQLVLFPEFRSVPKHDIEQKVILSPDCKWIASVLFNLKNSDVPGMLRFRRIQTCFENMFPGLEINVQTGKGIIIVTKGKTHEMPLDCIGGGMIEMINMIVHIVDTEGCIFVLDEPELHLHPHAQRAVANLIRDSAETNQIFCITHSSRFVHLDSMERIVRLRLTNGSTKMFSMNYKSLSDKEKSKIKLLNNSQFKESFFARAVMLMEGKTEEYFLSVSTRHTDPDLNSNGVSIISICGNNFELRVKILREFGIPHLVVLDLDTLVNIAESITVDGTDVPTSTLIKQLANLNLLKKEDQDTIKSLAKSIYERKKDTRAYNSSAVGKLKEIVDKHPFIHLLPSDFEGTIESEIYQEASEHTKKTVGTNKILSAMHVAENTDEYPPDVVNAINAVIELTRV